jgi:nucleoside-diphosphate-sugar epimerase
MSFATGERRPRLAVLGADGFVGSRVTQTALAAGAEVAAICVRSPWRLEQLGVVPSRLVQVEDGCWWDRYGLGTVIGALSGADALALLAYEPPERREGPDALKHELRVNAGGAAHVAELAEILGVRVVFASSADVYGPGAGSPVDESVEPRPVTPYAAAKLVAEERLAEASNAVCLRLSTVFGPYEHAARAIPAFMRALAAGEQPVVHGDGSDVRDYAYVGDVADAIVRCALDPAAFEAAAPVVNVGSGTGRSTLEVLDAVAAAMGVPADPRHVRSERPPSRLVLDVSRARAALGYENRTSFEEGLAAEAAAMAQEALA